MPVGLLPEVFVAFAYLLLPGIGLCFASRLALGRSALTALALVFGMGFASVGLGSLLLVLLGIFAPLTLLIFWVTLTGASWFVALRRGLLREHTDGWRDHVRADPAAAAAAALVVAGFAVVRWTVAPVANIGPTALRYWADGLEIADAGRLPRGTLQWGVILEPITSKVVLNAFNGGVSFLLGRDPIEPAGVLLFVVSIGLMVTAIALFSEWGIIRLAPVGAILLFANRLTGSEFTTDLGFNLAEDWGRLVGLSGVLAASIVYRSPSSDVRGSPRDGADRSSVFSAIVPGVLLGAAAGTHLIAASSSVAMVCALAVVLMLVGGRRRHVAARGGVILGAAVVVGSVVLLIPSGDLGFEGAGGDTRYEALRSRLGLPPDFDPTRFIVTHDLGTSGKTEEMGVAEVGEAFAYRAIGRRAPNERISAEELSGVWVVGPTIVALVLVGAAARWAPPDLKTAILWGAVLSLVLFGVGLVFALRYDLFVLEVFGDRRLFTYAHLAYVVVFIAGGEWALRSLERRRVSPTRAVSAAALALVMACGVVFLPHATWSRAADRGRLEAQLQLLRWVRDHVPCEGRVLANRRTLGSFQSVAGKAAVVEGMGPHIRPAVLTRAIAEIIRARRFFHHPRQRLDLLAERGVAAIVIATSGNGLGGYPGVGNVKADGFADVDVLRPVFRNPSGTVFLVEGFRPNPLLPRIAGRPGFTCGSIAGDTHEP